MSDLRGSLRDFGGILTHLRRILRFEGIFTDLGGIVTDLGGIVTDLGGIVTD